MTRRDILHVDMDAFYASVEQHDNPELRGKPVIVGGSAEGRGVVSAASYEARKYGVRSAMPAVTARRLCPQGVFLPVRMRRYHEVSEQLMELLHSFTPLVEPLSVDEAFLDVTGSEKLFGDAVTIAGEIKRRTREEFGLTASVGVAPNKFLAKVASDLEKPDGLTVVEHGKEAEFLAPLPLARLWGVGPATEKKLESLGVRTIGQLAAYPVEALTHYFGVVGEGLHELAHGRDDRPVVTECEAKSLGHETTFAQDVADMEPLRLTLLDLSHQVATRLRRSGRRARTVVLKLRDESFKTITRSETLPESTATGAVLFETSWRLLLASRTRKKVRLIGVTGANLVSEEADAQLPLFADDETRRRLVEEVADAIRERFGSGAITPASLLKRRGTEE
jgi:DNA polymerase-4